MFGKKKGCSTNVGVKNKGKRKSGAYFYTFKHKRKKIPTYNNNYYTTLVAVLAIAGARYSSEINKFGTVGSTHEHAAFIININGTPIDFSQERYQVQSRLIHVENGNGFTLHRHTDKVPFEFLRSVGMRIEDNCFIITDETSDQQGQQQQQQQQAQEREYCSNGQSELRVFVNGNELEPPSSLGDYILEDIDRILLIYGNQAAQQLSQELSVLEQVPILKN
ncbi:MAG: hypothetical protein ACRD5J_12585 [Nitrososphaeraceae archaeon]